MWRSPGSEGAASNAGDASGLWAGTTEGASGGASASRFRDPRSSVRRDRGEDVQRAELRIRPIEVADATAVVVPDELDELVGVLGHRPSLALSVHVVFRPPLDEGQQPIEN